jgi:hypothetical protein
VKVDASQGRDVNEGLSRGHGGFELAVAPVIFALLGLGLDSLFGIRPVLTILFTVVAFICVVIKQFYVYRHQMDEHSKARESTLTVGMKPR